MASQLIVEAARSERKSFRLESFERRKSLFELLKTKKGFIKRGSFSFDILFLL